MTTSRQRSITPFLVVSISLLAVVDFAMGPLMRWIRPNDLAAAIVYVCFGVIGAQAGLHAVWCVLAPVGPAKKLQVGVGAALLFLVAWALGHTFEDVGRSYAGRNYWEGVRGVLLSLPLLIIAIQLPLWAVRIWCRWHVVHVADCSRQSTYKAIGIRDILVATGVVAMALSAAQLAAVVRTPNSAAPLLPLLIGAGAAMAVSLLTTVPAVAATLRASRPWRAIICVLLLQVLVLFGILAIVTMVDRLPHEAIFGITFMVIGFVVPLNGGMLAARGFGYRLLWGRKGIAWAETPTPVPTAEQSEQKVP